MRIYRFSLAIFGVIILSMETTAKSRKDKERLKYKYKTKETNLCTVEANLQASVHCMCIGGTPPFNATSAECWIFSDVSKDHSIWPLFATQPHIVHLKFIVRPQGEFSFIPTKGLRHLTRLQVLTIEHATIHEIHSYAFSNISSLRELILGKNEISVLHEYAFAHLTNLTELNLDENRIAEFRRNVFVDLPSLLKLFAAQNNLSVIQEGCFMHLTHLVELDLYSNFISVLTKDTFVGLSELKKLDLSNNQIEMLGDLTFSELWILEELNLENNMIKYISDRAFAGLTQLRKLELSNNKLTKLSERLLGGVSTVNYLDLSSNHLESLRYESVVPILSNLMSKNSELKISDNKFVCDCRLDWLHQLHNDTKNDKLIRALDEITCYMAMYDNPEVTAAPTLGYNKKYIPGSSAIDVEYREPQATYGEGSISGHQRNTFNNKVAGSIVHHVKLRPFFEIPRYELPCPEKEKPLETTKKLLHSPGYFPGHAEKNLFNLAPRLTIPSKALILLLLARLLVSHT